MSRLAASEGVFSNLPITTSDLLILGGVPAVFLAAGFLVFSGAEPDRTYSGSAFS